MLGLRSHDERELSDVRGQLACWSDAGVYVHKQRASMLWTACADNPDSKLGALTNISSEREHELALECCGAGGTLR